MDRHLNLVARVDDDLVVSEMLGFAYQRDMAVTAKYDADYWNKCAGYEGSEIAESINRGRIDLVARHVGPDARVCDVGIGSGEFIRRRGGNTFGVDVNPAAMAWLHERGLWAGDLRQFGAFTFWDVLEHVPDPSWYFDRMDSGSWLFTSVPMFSDLGKIRESRHYRPGEHLYYFTKDGFANWMGSYGFELREHATFEMDAGRDSIHSFAFRRAFAL